MTPIPSKLSEHLSGAIPTEAEPAFSTPSPPEGLHSGAAANPSPEPPSRLPMPHKPKVLSKAQRSVLRALLEAVTDQCNTRCGDITTDEVDAIETSLYPYINNPGYADTHRRMCDEGCR